MYVEDFKRGSNKDIEPKDIFEMGLYEIRHFLYCIPVSASREAFDKNAIGDDVSSEVKMSGGSLALSWPVFL